VSPHRTDRPWQGQVEEKAPERLPEYDPTCYLCPGNARAGGVRNPKYEHTFVFENDFAALKLDTPPEHVDQRSLIVAKGEPGTCRVLCFSPRHDLTIAEMDLPDLQLVVDEWVAQYEELGACKEINWVQIFENRGAMMGASNPHPHCQIWANFSLPNEPMKEQVAQIDYWKEQDSCLLCDYVGIELDLRERVIFQNDEFVVLVPFWAIWPFEVLIVSQKHLTAMDQLNTHQRQQLAATLKLSTQGYNHVFNAPFPYTMGFHQRPTDGDTHHEWHFHCHFYPPLLRSATVRKFMVGYEMLGMPQRDITPETAADRLREATAKVQ
jgi:UDPglucose--hexose-1-phosphate uridylyltransferase